MRYRTFWCSGPEYADPPVRLGTAPQCREACRKLRREEGPGLLLKVRLTSERRRGQVPLRGLGLLSCPQFRLHADAGRQ
ncbi:hypothetical protein FQA47_016645 [Oryzias melastigma]|uniref:Uncharacterized protein n=1 Tax=Oryzias melastigma TaxID=30732 RepID=A0A834F033_ORYME|nr:hypothetical protein FQA47_016645 [Oryzias melastigma]